MHSNAYTIVLACLIGAGLLGGCQTAKVAHPLTAETGGSDSDSQLSFWHTLTERPVTSNDEAFHGLLLFLDGNDPASTYEQRVQVLRERRLLLAGFDGPADQAVERGTLAVAIARVLDIKGGIMLRLSGGDCPRYAVRELQFLEIYPPSSPRQTFSGAEFVSVIGRMEDYQRGAVATALPTPQAAPEPLPRP